MRVRYWSSDVCSSVLLLLFLRSVRGLVLLIKVLAVIHDLADRRFRVWRNFNQIETFFFSLGLGITRQHDPELLTIVRDYADPRRGDPIGRASCWERVGLYV